MDTGETIAYLIFASYFLLILISFIFVFKSILSGQHAKRLLEVRPSLYLRVAVVALVCTWFFMIEYMRWSFKNHSYTHPKATVGHWLQDTALFEEAWSIVSRGPASWWWSSWICTWTVLYTAVVWIESGRRGIKHPWAFMLLGQLVAMSVSTSLFLTALSLRPRISSLQLRPVLLLLLPLCAAMVTVYLNPHVVGTPKFMPNLLAMHALLLVPLFLRPKTTSNAKTETGAEGRRPSALGSYLVYSTLAGIGFWIHRLNTKELLAVIPRDKAVLPSLYRHIFSHPAQGSISLDVIWVGISLLCWFLTTGSITAILAKATVTTIILGTGIAGLTGVDWALVGSVVPIVLLALIGGLVLGLNRLRAKNATKRKALLDSLGIVEDGVIAGTSEEPPKMSGKRVVVGFWHPYCNAGGGGERVLWTAIAHLQKKHPDVISLVYSGDYPAASKEEILSKIKDRFSIELSPSTLHYIPLPSRHLVDDGFWRYFTLLGQSIGSMYLAWQGLCGKDGLWGDIFLDSMGYAFTYPIVRLLAGSEITIGAYIHYPTVSADMVKRVRERSYGVENAGASKSFIKTQIKLLYYRIFTSLYATSLLFSEHTMTNSSWTFAHITSLLTKGRNSFLASVFLLDEKSFEKDKTSKPHCEVVYPPCDTAGLVSLGKLEKRDREIVSLAQFRPEKEHVKQILALAKLFEDHPQYRSGPEKITLTMMGGARHPADEARVESLRTKAKDLGIEDNVQFLVNAPYPEIVRRLGRASIGLNTMQDEHFGINVVEFMAAGLIPIVHASAGPLLDIVVPAKSGQRTGYHAKTPDEFADAIHEVLSMSIAQQTKMRKAARELAVEKFSEESFNRGFEKGWEVLVGKVEERRKALEG